MEEEIYVLTEYGILLSVCEDYGINVDHITPKVAEHFFNDFMEALCNAGYVQRKSDE